MSNSIPVTWNLGLTFNQLREANVKRCEESYHTIDKWSPAEWLMCVTGELGELAHEIKHLRRQNNLTQIRSSEGPSNKGQIANELADVAIYLDLLAASFGIDLGEAIARKFNETSDKVGSDVKLEEYNEPTTPIPTVDDLVEEDLKHVPEEAVAVEQPPFPKPFTGGIL